MVRINPAATFAALFLTITAFEGPALGQNPAVTVNVDANANRRAINPNIYGMAYADTPTLSDLNILLNRNGGNNTSRYNWNVNADNRGSDYYFESIGDTSAVAGERGDTFISNSKSGGAQALLTIPMVGWVARVGANRSKLASFSIAKYGAQTGNDFQWFPDAGNGVLSSTGQNVTGNDPNDANVLSDSTFQNSWMQHLVAKWGPANSGGLRYYLMDNEPSLWHSTHRDVHPTGATMAEIRNKILDYGGKVKANDSSALVVGPEEWGWSGYFYSGYDQQYTGIHGWSTIPDRAANGNWDYLPWLLDQLRQNNASTGKRILDVFSVHYYPQGGEFSNDVTTAMQTKRNQSTRSLWDPSYVDQSWINSQVQLIPRIKGWVNTYYPGTFTGITEYNWGAEGHINGATTQADILGIFGREGLDLATRWTTPGNTTPTYKAIKMYRNYDGSKSTFGDTSVSATVPNPDNVSAFAAQRTIDGALTVMVISKYLSGTTAVTLNLANFTSTGTAQVWQLTSANAINRLSDITVSGSSLGFTAPAQSITLFVLPKSAGKTPTFTSSTSVSPSSVAPGATATISTTVTDAGGALSNGIVDLEVYNLAGTKVGQQAYTGQNFTANQSRPYSWAWVVPSTVGTYTVKVGVFNSTWGVNYYWNGAAATVTVTAGDSAQYNFESGAQGWVSSGGILTGVAGSTVKAYAGSHSLAVSINSPSAGGAQTAYVGSPATPAGATVTFHIWIPSGSTLTSIQPFVQQGAGGNWTWTGNWQPIASLAAGAWNTLTVTVPATAATPLSQLGVQFQTNGVWTGVCYVDSVGW